MDGNDFICKIEITYMDMAITLYIINKSVYY